jgi:integrase
MARNFFIFSVFTGLSFTDLRSLKWNHIVKGKDGMTWIRKERDKTHEESCIPLLDIPLQILETYGNPSKEGLVFDVPPYPTIVTYMRIIKKSCGLKEFTFHMARHTWATTICLSNGVPIETLSRTMGHTNIATTQVYGKITNRKINEDMSLLEQRLDGKFQFGRQGITVNEEKS